jgi:diguanylate cyclase (GGDEF)-like protein/PAS domain S-box-containing protein
VSNGVGDNFGAMPDAAEREEIERRLKNPEARYRALVEHIPAVTYIDAVDEVSSAVYMSPQVEAMLGYAPEEWLVDPSFFLKLLHPGDRERVLAENERTNRSGEPFDMEYRLIARDGRTIWVRDEAVLVKDGDRPLYWQGVMTDVTERKALEERLRHQALHDHLTGLPNRTLLMDRLAHALVRAERRETKVAVLFMDLDNFKYINDSMSHEAGDRLLVEVAERLRDCLRAEDTVARLGGDEFAILLEDLGREQEATAVASQVAQALRTPILVDDREIFVTTSIGIAFGSSGEDRPEVLLREADVAMYRAKAGGKDNHAVYHPEMGELSSQRLTLEGDLRRALEREELKIYYQPKVLVETGKIVALETLVRWEHPERGLLLPADFVPLAEETRLIVPIGWWVLEEACRQVKEWQKLYPSDPPLAINVNLSARQFYDPDLVERVARVLEETALDPSSLVLEITEGTAMEEALSTTTLGALKGLGVKLAIDDFGTGYSSLSYLKHFPVDAIKIDRSIVEGLGHDRGDSAIVSATITLAHALGLEVIAEGVETDVEAAELLALGCDVGQGYYWWTPQPAGETAELLGAHLDS